MLPLYSPTPLRDFIWVADFSDGTYLAEFDHLTKEKNDFYSIRKHDLIRFGMIGHGYRFHYDVFGGAFHLPQGKFDFVYKHAGKEYKLTEQPIIYNDMITYKKAESTFSPLGLQSSTQIVEYVFGYKQKLLMDDMHLHVQIQFSIPFGQPMYLAFRLVSNKGIDGQLQILQNNSIVEVLDAPLTKNFSSELNWVVC